MIEVPASVEDYLADPLREQKARDRLASFLGGIELVRLAQIATDVSREGRRVSDGFAGNVVHYLRVDVPGAAKNAHSRSLRRPAYLSAAAQFPALSPHDSPRD